MVLQRQHPFAAQSLHKTKPMNWQTLLQDAITHEQQEHLNRCRYTIHCHLQNCNTTTTTTTLVMEQMIVEKYETTTEQVDFEPWKNNFLLACTIQYEQLCNDFFYAQKQSELFTLLQQVDNQGQIEDSSLQHNLHPYGFFRKTNTFWQHVLGDGIVEHWEGTKNQVRRAFHVDNQKKQVQSLYQALQAVYVHKTLQAAPMQAFVVKYGKDVSVHSFLHGLANYLEQQAKSQQVMAWQLSTSSLIQHFMQDALVLLYSLNIEWQPHAMPSDLMTPLDHAFVLKPNVTNAQIKAILSALPTKYQTNAAGSITTLTVARQVAADASSSSTGIIAWIVMLLHKIKNIFS